MPDGCGFDSAALCVSEHVLDVGGERRIGVDVVHELARGDAEPDRGAEDVDRFLAGMLDDTPMRSLLRSTMIFDQATVSATR
jgi:hypothetical protein